MSDKHAYLVESVYHTRPSHHLCDTLQEALSTASVDLDAWIVIDDTNPRYDPADKARIRSLLDEKRYAQAVEEWNQLFPAQPVAIHEVAVTERNCHHSYPTITEGVWYVVERDSGEYEQDHCLDTGLNQALESVRHYMTHPPCNCGKATWKKVGRLLRLGKIADAMDAWNQGKNSDPTFAIHQIRLVRANCQQGSRINCSLN
jgi:hypothetical protein